MRIVFLNRLKSKGMHTKMILTLFFISLFLSVILSVSLYKIFSETSISVAKENSVNSLAKNISQIELIQKKTISLGEQLITSPVVVAAIFQEQDLSAAGEVRLYRKVREILSGDSMIHSVCFFNAANGKLYSFFDVESDDRYREVMLERLENKWETRNAQFLPGKINYKKVTGTEVTDHIITAIIMNSYLPYEEIGIAKNDFSRSSVIINLNADVIKSTLMPDIPDRLSKTTIVNQEGLVVFDFDMSQMGEYLPDSYLSDVLNSDLDSGEVIRNIAEKKSLVTYKRIQSPNWVFLNVYAFDDLFKEIYSIRISVVYFIILLLAFSVVYAIFVSRKLYQPFEILMESIAGEYDPKDTLTDMDYLNQTFNKLKEQSQLLEGAYRESGILLKREYLSKLIHGFTMQAQGLKNEYGNRMNLPDEKMLDFFVLEIEMNAKSVSESENITGEQENFRFTSLEILISKAISRSYLCESVECIESCICLLIGIQKGSDWMSAKRNLVKIKTELQLLTEQNLCFSIGFPVESLSDLSRSYENAIQLIQYRFVYGLNSFLSFDMDGIYDRPPYIAINNEKLISAVRSCNQKEAEKIITEILEKLSACQYDFIQLTINQMMFELVKIDYHFYETNSRKASFDKISTSVESLKTIQEAKLFFVSYCEGIMEKIKTKKTAFRSNMFDETVRYISQHYSDYELSTDSLADMAHMTPGYFGKLFRENVGKSVTEFINETRLNEARELLEKSELSVNNISSMVGFNNTTYFITSFKKKYYMSPSLYRKQHGS